MAESTTKAPKGATATTGNGDTPPATTDTPAPTAPPKATTTYLAFVWDDELGDGAWRPITDGNGKPKDFVVPSGQGSQVQEQVLADLAAEDREAGAGDPAHKPATSFRIAFVSARFWVDETFEQEPPPPPQFKKRS